MAALVARIVGMQGSSFIRMQQCAGSDNLFLKQHRLDAACVLRELALAALLLNPIVTDIDSGRAILDDLLIEFAEYLPQFEQ